MRIRTIKPDFYRHERLFEAEQAVQLPLRVSFSGLWGCCDREGRFKWRPKQLKLDIVPYDLLDFEDVLEALCQYGFVVKYQVGLEYYGYVPTFKTHQVINQREAASRLPPPPDMETHVHAHACTCMHGNACGEREGNRKGTTTTTFELPTEEEPAPPPPPPPPRSCCASPSEESRKSENPAELPNLSEQPAELPSNSQKKAARQAPPDSQLAEGTLAQDALIFPAKLSPAEVVLAWQLVCLFTLLDAQTLLDELAWRLDPRHNPVHTPLAFLRILCDRHQAGTFQPSGALRVREAREARRRQAGREAAARQKPPPRGGGGAPPTDPPDGVQACPEPCRRARPPRERPAGLQQMRAYLGRVPRAGR